MLGRQLLGSLLLLMPLTLAWVVPPHINSTQLKNETDTCINRTAETWLKLQPLPVHLDVHANERPPLEAVEVTDYEEPAVVHDDEYDPLDSESTDDVQSHDYSYGETNNPSFNYEPVPGEGTSNPHHQYSVDDGFLVLVDYETHNRIKRDVSDEEDDNSEETSFNNNIYSTQITTHRNDESNEENESDDSDEDDNTEESHNIDNVNNVSVKEDDSSEEEDSDEENVAPRDEILALLKVKTTTHRKERMMQHGEVNKVMLKNYQKSAMQFFLTVVPHDEGDFGHCGIGSFSKQHRFVKIAECCLQHKKNCCKMCRQGRRKPSLQHSSSSTDNNNTVDIQHKEINLDEQNIDSERFNFTTQIFPSSVIEHDINETGYSQEVINATEIEVNTTGIPAHPVHSVPESANGEANICDTSVDGWLEPESKLVIEYAPPTCGCLVIRAYVSYPVNNGSLVLTSEGNPEYLEHFDCVLPNSSSQDDDDDDSDEYEIETNDIMDDWVDMDGIDQANIIPSNEDNIVHRVPRVEYNAVSSKTVAQDEDILEDDDEEDSFTPRRGRDGYNLRPRQQGIQYRYQADSDEDDSDEEYIPDFERQSRNQRRFRRSSEGHQESNAQVLSEEDDEENSFTPRRGREGYDLRPRRQRINYGDQASSAEDESDEDYAPEFQRLSRNRRSTEGDHESNAEVLSEEDEEENSFTPRRGREGYNLRPRHQRINYGAQASSDEDESDEDYVPDFEHQSRNRRSTDGHQESNDEVSSEDDDDEENSFTPRRGREGYNLRPRHQRINYGAQASSDEDESDEDYVPDFEHQSRNRRSIDGHQESNDEVSSEDDDDEENSFTPRRGREGYNLRSRHQRINYGAQASSDEDESDEDYVPYFEHQSRNRRSTEGDQESTLEHQTTREHRRKQRKQMKQVRRERNREARRQHRLGQAAEQGEDLGDQTMPDNMGDRREVRRLMREARRQHRLDQAAERKEDVGDVTMPDNMGDRREARRLMRERRREYKMLRIKNLEQLISRASARNTTNGTTYTMFGEHNGETHVLFQDVPKHNFTAREGLHNDTRRWMAGNRYSAHSMKDAGTKFCCKQGIRHKKASTFVREDGTTKVEDCGIVPDELLMWAYYKYNLYSQECRVAFGDCCETYSLIFWQNAKKQAAARRHLRNQENRELQNLH